MIFPHRAHFIVLITSSFYFLLYFLLFSVAFDEN
nr:MAG TPA: hypothetical protein [Caudoviricetes sp.]